MCALHWPTDHNLVTQRLQHLVAGHTVDESVSHLVIDTAVCKNTGRVVNLALDTLCGPCGIVSYELARRDGYDVDPHLPAHLRAPPLKDSTGTPRKLLPIEPAPKPIHSVDGSPLAIYGRINGWKLCINNQHDIEIDVLVSGPSMGCDVIAGMPSLAKMDAMINCKRGIAHFTDLNGNVGVFGRGVQQLSRLPTPDETSVGSILPANVCADITAAVHSANGWLRDTDYAEYLRQRRHQTAKTVSQRLQRAGEQRAALYHELDAFLDRCTSEVDRDTGRRRHSDLSKWLWSLSSDGTTPNEDKAPTTYSTEWPIGPISNMPLPPMHLDEFYFDKRWNRAEAKTLAIMRRRYNNIALARIEASHDLDMIATLGDMLQAYESKRNVTRQPPSKPDATATTIATASCGVGLDRQGARG